MEKNGTMDLIKELEKVKGSHARRGMAKVQFHRNRRAILAALKAGYTRKEVWKFLNDQGHFAYSYAQFLNYTRELESNYEYRS